MGNYCSNRKSVFVSKEAFVPLANDGSDGTEMKLLAFELGDELTLKVGFNLWITLIYGNISVENQRHMTTKIFKFQYLFF